MKYLIVFLGINVMSNIIATFFMFNIMKIDIQTATIIMQKENAAPITTFAFGIGGFTIVIGIISILIATKLLIKPIKNITDGSKEVATGNFNIEIPENGNDEVTELTRNFNKMTKALMKNEYLHKDFVSNVSHEFKTPLTSLQGYAELIKKNDISDEKRDEYIDIIISESKKLSYLSSNLLKLSELENTSFPSKKDVIYLDDQIRDALVLLQNEWELKNIDISLQLDRVKFIGDKALLYQVWVNLISNAIKYSNQNGKISIALYENDSINVVISDNGIGMSAEDVDRVFERFYKADSSRNSIGTGLGLSIVKKIIEIHGGKISLQSKINEGSNFKIVF